MNWYSDLQTVAISREMGWYFIEKDRVAFGFAVVEVQVYYSG